MNMFLSFSFRKKGRGRGGGSNLSIKIKTILGVLIFKLGKVYIEDDHDSSNS